MKLFLLVCGLLLSAQVVLATKGLSPLTKMALETGRILPSWTKSIQGVVWETDGQMPSYLREVILADIVSNPLSEREAREYVEDHYKHEQIVEFNKMVNSYKRPDTIADKHGKVSFGDFSADELESIAVIEFEEDSDFKKLLHNKEPLLIIFAFEGDSDFKKLLHNKELLLIYLRS